MIKGRIVMKEKKRKDREETKVDPDVSVSAMHCRPLGVTLPAPIYSYTYEYISDRHALFTPDVIRLTLAGTYFRPTWSKQPFSA